MAINVTWLGHACWRIDSGPHKLLVDPFLDDNPAAACKAADLEADFVLVTHGHGDHVADAAAICRRTGATLVANYEICEWHAGRGVNKSEPMNLGGQIELPFGRVKMTIAHHSSTMPDGAPGGNPGGFVVKKSPPHQRIDKIQLTQIGKFQNRIQLIPRFTAIVREREMLRTLNIKEEQPPIVGIDKIDHAYLPFPTVAGLIPGLTTVIAVEEEQRVEHTNHRKDSLLWRSEDWR